MATILQMMLSKSFSCIHFFSFWLKFSLKFGPIAPIGNSAALVQVMVWHQSGAKPLSEPKMLSITSAYMHHLASMGWRKGWRKNILGLNGIRPVWFTIRFALWICLNEIFFTYSKAGINGSCEIYYYTDALHYESHALFAHHVFCCGNLPNDDSHIYE